MTQQRPAPQFRPRGQHGGRRRLPSRRVILAAAGVLGVLAIAGIVTLIAVSVSGDDDAKADTATPVATFGGTSGGPEPSLPGPAVQYDIQLGDLTGRYDAHDADNYQLSSLAFASIGPFKGVSEGQQYADQWGFLDGWTADLVPDGQLAGVLQGRYYVTAQVFLFQTVDGARQAYSKFQQFYAQAPGSEPQDVQGLGNESSGFKLIQGTISNSDAVAAYHRFLFRRGNLVAVVQTMGVDQFMNIGRARELATVIDQKALGQRPAPTPTPNSAGTAAAQPPVR